ncbi:MAG: LysR family transcriptional regulator [Chloroflexota bacterium]|nr:LysR family transcriptional regulator [Chloroflexota bacterium]MDE2969106.1 LysR family transcriptional regulator [Chloroflexota bacterium]
MDLRELRSFCAVAQFGSITKAADQLMIRQPAVTLHIQELERETGVTLLDRSRRPVQLTPAGAHLAELARPLLRQFDSLPVETSSYARQGSLTVASTTEMARNMLVDSIVTYRESYPDTRLQLRSGRLPEVLRMVRDRDADLGFVPLIGRFGEFNVETLFTNERVLLAAKGHPVLDEPIESIHQIARWPLIVNVGTRDNPTYIEDKLNEAGLDYNVIMRLDHFDSIKRYVSKGLGIGVVPRIILETGDDKSLGIVALGHLLDIQPVGIVTVRDTPMSRFAQQFVNMLRETIPAHIAPLWP